MPKAPYHLSDAFNKSAVAYLQAEGPSAGGAAVAYLGFFNGVGDI